MADSDGSRFQTTHWSLVLAAGVESDPLAREALESLCRTYWPPIYHYLRANGHGSHEAEDLTQGFFLKLLEKGGIGRARADRGRFRTFLLSSLKHFLADERDRDRAQKRGGGGMVVSMDAWSAEERLRREPGCEGSPEKGFDRRWAGVLLDRALARLERRMSDAASADRFRVLRPFLTDAAGPGYGEAARALGIAEPAARVAVHRMRRQFGEALREEVLQTVGSREEVDAELRELQRILRG